MNDQSSPPVIMSVSEVGLATFHNDSEMTAITRKTLRSFHEQFFGVTL
jgi:hypothetical protein